MNESKISAILGALVILVVAVMVVNYFRNLRPGDTTGGVSTEQPAATPSVKMHTVERGESLWTIAEKYYSDGYKWTEIRDANDLTNSDSLNAGQELIIPTVEAIAASPVASSSPIAQVSPSPIVTSTPVATISPSSSPVATPEKPEVIVPSTEKITGDKYTVVSGDSLWEIAERAYGNGNKWVEIAKANNLKNPNVIHSGNSFTLPR